MASLEKGGLNVQKPFFFRNYITQQQIVYTITQNILYPVTWGELQLRCIMYQQYTVVLGAENCFQKQNRVENSRRGESRGSKENKEDDALLYFTFWSVTLHISLLRHRYCQSGTYCESLSLMFQRKFIACRLFYLLTYLLLYYTYNSFTLPFQGRTLNTHAAEANLRRFPLPQAPGWGAIQFLTTSCSKKFFLIQRMNTACVTSAANGRA